MFLIAATNAKSWTSIIIAGLTVNYFTVAVLLVVSPGLIFVYIMDPSCPWYFFSVFPTEIQQRLEVWTLGVIFETLWCYWSFTAWAVHFPYWTAIMFQVILWLDASLK